MPLTPEQKTRLQLLQAKAGEFEPLGRKDDEQRQLLNAIAEAERAVAECNANLTIAILNKSRATTLSGLKEAKLAVDNLGRQSRRLHTSLEGAKRDRMMHLRGSPPLHDDPAYVQLLQDVVDLTVEVGNIAAFIPGLADSETTAFRNGFNNVKARLDRIRVFKDRHQESLMRDKAQRWLKQDLAERAKREQRSQRNQWWRRLRSG